MLEQPCQMAGLRVVEEEVNADAFNLMTEGIKGILSAGTSGGSASQAGEHPFPLVIPRPS